MQSRKTELAWAAGFIDGEGHFKCAKYTSKSGKVYGSLALEVAQIDPRVLIRLKKALQLGKVYGPYGPYKGTCSKTHSINWKFITKGWGQYEKALEKLLPYLSPVKKKQAKDAIREARLLSHNPSLRRTA